MPDTQFVRCLQYDLQGGRRLSQRLRDIQREEWVENDRAKIEKGIPMKVTRDMTEHKSTHNVFAIGDEFSCVTKDMIEESELSFSLHGLLSGRGSVTLLDGTILLGNFRGGKREGRGGIEGGKLKL